MVDGGFDVDGVICRFGVHEGHEDVQRDAEHGFSRAAEFGGGAAGGVEVLAALLVESEDAGEEDDVLAVELHGGGVLLESFEFIVGGGETLVQGFHRVHLSASFGVR